MNFKSGTIIVICSIREVSRLMEIQILSLAMSVRQIQVTISFFNYFFTVSQIGKDRFQFKMVIRKVCDQNIASPWSLVNLPDYVLEILRWWFYLS